MSEYNALLSYALFRRNVVSDIPFDIDLSVYHLNNDEKELISSGLTQVRECLLSIYDSVIDYAENGYMTQKVIDTMNEKGGIMTVRRDAQMYLNSIFGMLYNFIKFGECNFEETTITITKEVLNIIRKNTTYKPSLLCHLEFICRIELYRNDRISQVKNCDKISLIFDDNALLYTLRHIVKNNTCIDYFPYGDFRLYSKSGRTEDNQNRFPNSVRLKALGAKKYNLYQLLNSKIRDIFSTEQVGENTYQGHGLFQILNEYYIGYKNTRFDLIIQENRLIASFRLDFDAFKKLPDIIGQLSQNIKDGILNLPQCQDCRYKCKRKRVAVFDESILPQKVLRVCKWPVASCIIESGDDIKSILIICSHIRKYTKLIKMK